jgi:hypothetical protein
VADALDFQFDLFSSAAELGPALSLGRRAAMIRSAMAEVSTLSEGKIRGSDRRNHAHIPSGVPLRGIEVMDGEE